MVPAKMVDKGNVLHRAMDGHDSLWLMHDEAWESRDETLFRRQRPILSEREMVHIVRSKSKLMYEKKD